MTSKGFIPLFTAASLLAGVALDLFIASTARASSIRSYGDAFARSGATASTSCLPSDIRNALARASAACGIKVISTFRPGARIAGKGQRSMHATCRAADFTTSSPACVLRVLSGWHGKLSTDYARMQHFHIDNGPQARFAHGSFRRLSKNGRFRIVRETTSRQHNSSASNLN